ncbi:MAG: diguanylate cyclase [Aquisalimonadaceae bacterium]
MNESLTILLADDDHTPRALLRRMIESWGHQVLEAENGEQAWQVLTAQSPPRIAVLDWMMPGIDGVTLCQRLQQQHDRPLVYTILLTSKRDEQDLVHALDSGAHDFQSKPPRPGELRARIAVGQRLVDTHDRLQESLQEMERLATTDALTNVPNRRHFFDLAEHALQRALRYHTPISALLMDLDNFKTINDVHGHHVGDAALRRVATVCQAGMRGCDIFGRYGGDEMVAILTDTALAGALEVADRLRSTVAQQPVDAEGQTVALALSIGVATLGNGVTSLDTLLHHADTALLQAKQAGRNRVLPYEGDP